MALGHIEVEVFGTGAHGAGVGRQVVTDETVELEVRRLFLLRKSGAAGEQRCHCKKYYFFHIKQTGKSW